MKRGFVILSLGLVLGVAAYCGFYWAGTAGHRALLKSNAPELAWLKKEFNLSDGEFSHIAQLHGAYLPHCQEMCRRIEAKNEELRQLLLAVDKLTPELEAKMEEAAKLRVDCQKMMWNHFLEVSRSMPPEQARRYLIWVQERTLLPEGGMSHAK